MKAEQFMVNDHAYYRNRLNGGSAHLIQISSTDITANCDGYSGVSISENILLNNGFEYVFENGNLMKCCIDDSDVIFFNPTENLFSCRLFGKTEKFHANCVHQLQDHLRAFGLTYYANNFKIR